MHLAHHPIFVALSILTAWLGAWTALDLFRRTQAHTGLWRRAWVAAAGVAMGLSIWSMHFIAMLGFNPGSEVRYDVQLTVLSLLLAIAATTLAFMSARPARSRQIASGFMMGAGICGMHYVGMAALITGATLSHDPVFVALAFLVAVGASAGALMVAMRETTFAQRVLTAVVLGFAIVGMHYTGMFGVRITASAASHVQTPGMEPFVLAIGIAAGTLFILLLALVAALSDRRFEAVAVQETIRSEKQLRAILDNLPIGVFVAASPAGEVRFANAEAERLLGHPLEGSAPWAHAGGAIDDAGRPLAPEAYVLHTAMRENRRVGPVVQTYRHADGHVSRLEVTAAPIPSREDNRALSVVAFQDVTAKLAAEDQARQSTTLRESEERFRFIAEQAPVMLWMSDARGRCVYQNKLLREFQSTTADQATDEWISSLVAEERSEATARVERSLAAQEGFSLEASFNRADGDRRVIHVLACPRSSEEGQFLGFVGVNTDVTEAREAERKLQTINELLEQRVGAALAEKAQAEAALMHAQRLESIGRLTGGVAHDFNNLLTVVIGALDIILRDPDNAVRRTRLGEAALTAARRGERLTTQLLAFARRQPLQPESWDLNKLIQECEPLLKRAAGENVSLTLRLCADAAVALIDRTQFEASLLNLVVNAVDASEKGGEVGIETRIVPTRSLGQVNTEEKQISIRVWDRGQGMSPDTQERIFDPFFTTKAPGKGTGLGLSQVYGFVKQSGGEIQVRSAPGEGTCLSVSLPLRSAVSQVIPPRPTTTIYSTPSLRILLAEDDQSVAGITQAMLGELGHEVICTSNAEQALRVLQSATPLDVLLTDVIMPGAMTGVDLAREAVKLRSTLRVLLSTGYAGESQDEAIARGAWPVLRKPYLQLELADALEKLISETEAGQSRSAAMEQ